MGDEQEWCKAERLAVAAAVAPSLRAASEKARTRRVARVDAEGNVVGYTTLAEVQAALLKARAIELETTDGVRPTVVVCRHCGRDVKQDAHGGKVIDVCRGGCDRSCSTPGCKNLVSVVRAREYARGLKPAPRCRSCVSKDSHSIEHARRAVSAERLSLWLKSRSPEQRAEASRKAWETRRRNGKGKMGDKAWKTRVSHGFIKLSPAQVAEIRAIHAVDSPPTHAETARRYGVSRATIGDILRGKTWSGS